MNSETYVLYGTTTHLDALPPKDIEKRQSSQNLLLAYACSPLLVRLSRPVTHVWYGRLPTHHRQTHPVALSTFTSAVAVSHLCSRADKILRAVTTMFSSSRRSNLIPIWCDRRGASPTVCVHWVAFSVQGLHVFVLHGIYEEGVSSVEGGEIVEITVEFFCQLVSSYPSIDRGRFEHTGLLPPPTVRVFSDANNDSIDCDQDCQNNCQNRLHSNQNHTSDSFGGLSNSQLFNKDQNTDD